MIGSNAFTHLSDSHDARVKEVFGTSIYRRKDPLERATHPDFRRTFQTAGLLSGDSVAHENRQLGQTKSQGAACVKWEIPAELRRPCADYVWQSAPGVPFRGEPSPCDEQRLAFRLARLSPLAFADPGLFQGL